MVIALIKRGQLLELTIASKATYCRLVIVKKVTSTNVDYVSNFNSNMKFNELIEVVVANAAICTNINEKPLNYKQAMKELFAKQ